MKLHAAQHRGNRDAGDLAVLLPACAIATVDAAEDLSEAHYPGDSFPARTHQLVTRSLEQAIPPPITPTMPPLG